MHKSSLTFQALKNSSYNFIGYLLPLVITFVITPIIVFKLGIKQYGIYLFINTVISFIGLIDLGLGMAVSKHMSFYFGKKDLEAVKRLAHTANSLFLITAVLGFLVSLFIGLGIHYFTPDKFLAYKDYSVLFIIGGGIYFMTTIGSTYNSILFGLQRFDLTTKISLTHFTLTSISMFLIVTLGGSLQEIFYSQLLLATGLMIFNIYKAHQMVPVATIKLGWSGLEIKHCYKFGIAASLNNIANTSLTSLDKLIIPFFAGPTNLTYYNMPGSVTTKIPGISNTLSITLFPTVSQLSGEESIDRIRTLYTKSFRLIIIMASTLTIACISFSYKILEHWLNTDFAEKSFVVLIILALTNFILALFGPLSNFLLGLGKLKSITVTSITMSIVNIIFLLLLLPKYGIKGAAVAYLVSVLPVMYLFYFVEKHYLSLKERKKDYIKIFSGLVFTSFIMISLNLLLSSLIVNILTLLIVGGSSIIIHILLYKGLGFFENEDWRDMELFYKIIINKIALKR
jgi:O-antigen/teichoic acid export membrane protein